MRELLEYLARALVDDPERVSRRGVRGGRRHARARALGRRGRLRPGHRPRRPHRPGAAHRRQGRGGQGQPPRARRHRRLSDAIVAVDASGRLAAARAAVGRPHGLDGSFHVTRPARALLRRRATSSSCDGAPRAIERRAGTDERPILRLAGHAGREAAEALRGAPLRVPRAEAPPLEEDEYWAARPRGLRASYDGERRGRRGAADAAAAVVRGARGRARRTAASCSCRWSATRSARSTSRRGGSTSTSRSWESDADADRRLHAVPAVVRLVPRPAPRRQRARARVTRCECVDYRAHTPLTAGQVDDTPFGGGAGMVLRVDVVEAALRARYGERPGRAARAAARVALTPGRPAARRRRSSTSSRPSRR